MKKGHIILLYFLFVFGCKSRNTVPHSIIPDNKMELIIWDMTRADEFLTAYVINKDSAVDKKAESIRMYEQIFRIHKTSKEEFQNSLSFYQAHPAMLKIMMDSLSAKEKDTSIGQREPKTITDSLLFRKSRIPKLP